MLGGGLILSALASQTQLINQLASALSANRQRKNVKQPSEREPQQQNAEQQHQNGRQCRFHAMEVQREREVPSPPKSCVNMPRLSCHEARHRQYERLGPRTCC